jgi:hypothetical protein
MRSTLLVVFGLALGIVGTLVLVDRNASEAQGKSQILSHDVYFTVKDKKNIGKLVEACHKYLSNHPGEVFYAAGPRCTDLEREVNDKDFDVGLHIVFKDKAAHDKYQDAKRHVDFIQENKDLWATVRVFDSYVAR